MGKVILGALLGIIIVNSGVYAGYVYLSGLDNGNNLFLLAAAVLLTGIGVFILLKAGKSNALVVKKMDNANTASLNNKSSSFENILNKNNELSEKWSKSVENRDRLKMLQMAGEIKEPTND